MKKIIIFSFFAILAISKGFAQSKINENGLNAQQTQTLETLFAKKGEIYFTFNVNSRDEISRLTKIISIDGVQNGVVNAIANKREFARFLQLGYAYTLQPNPNETVDIKNLKTIEVGSVKQLLTVWNAYPTYTAYETIMQQFATDYPNICKLVTIATLPSGRKILALKITDNPNAHENEPQFLYTSSMHGDEIAGYVGMLHYIDYLLTNYGTDVRVTNLVNSMEIWINPSANPDGTYAGGNATVTGATRANANNVDLNRNYPDPQDGPHPDGNAYQPETVAFMAFADTMNFVMSANFHGGSEVANYPWDTYVRQHADTNWWIRESKKYADTTHVHSPAGYFTGVNPSGVTNGFLWYEVNGGRQDYMNYFKHCREFTIELSNTKILQTTNLLNNWEYNYRSWLGYMEEALHGVRGIIKDACTNQPIRAKVFITGHDVDSSEVYSSRWLGNYHRPIYQGAYNITYSAPGYVSQTINNVTVADGQVVVQNIALSPAAPVANFTAASTNICGGTAQFTDLTGSATSWNWTFGDGSTSTQQNPTHIYNTSGTYSVKLVIQNCAGRDSITKNSFLTINIPTPPSVVVPAACAPATVALTATASGQVNWYSAANSSTPLASGASYTTSPLNTSTTFWVENETAGPLFHTGATATTIGAGGFFTGATYHYLRFNATSPFKLLSVLVNANTAGNRTIELRNAANTVLQSLVINVPAGQSRINLNFNVPIGTGLQLGVAGANSLYRNSAGAAYPYTLNNIVSIVGNSANNTTAYYYFYDWEITQPCTSPRIPVLVAVNQNTNTPTISQSNNMLTSSAATGNQWYSTSTGIIAGQTNQNFTPTASGTYYVVQTDANGCVSNSSNAINIIISGTSNIFGEKETIVNVFPNPNNGNFSLDLSGLAAENKTIILYNLIGQAVFSIKNTTEKMVYFNQKDLAKGIYTLKIFGENNQKIGTGRVVVE